MLLSIVMAVLSALAVVRPLTAMSQGPSTPADRATVDVVVAVRNLYVGQPIGLEDVALRAVSASLVPDASVSTRIEDVLGRTPRERILADEMVRSERLASLATGEGLNAIVAPGRRAMTITVATESSLAGLLRAGNYVDILATMPLDEAGGHGWVTDTILQGIKVLAVGNELDTRGISPDPAAAGARSGPGRGAGARLRPSITLEVGPEEAEKLAFASNRADISVVLRGDIDLVEVPPGDPMDIETMLGWEKAEPPAPRLRAAPVVEPAPRNTIDVIMGERYWQVTEDGVLVSAPGARGR